jgi:phospholipase/carboxylesterase
MLLKTIEIETAPNPRATVLLMHGLGADGNDFVPIAGELELSAVGPVRFVFPNAPIMPVTINGGYQMPAWYDILGPDLAKREDEAGLRASLAAIEALLAREKARGIPAQRIVIAGFSQGCAMALLTGLRHAERLAGIVALSGYLPLASKTAWCNPSALLPRTTPCAHWATTWTGTNTPWRTRCAWRRLPI